LTPRSARVKQARQLTRRSVRSERREFLAEGPQAVREAVAHPGGAAGRTLIELYATPEAAERHADVVAAARAAGAPVLTATPEVIAEISDTVTPQGLVAVCRFLDSPFDAILAARPRLVAVLAHVRDPGNAGTVLRGADAAGAAAVLVSDSSVDVHSPKVVRSTAGSLFHLPVVTGLPIEETLHRLRAAGLRLLAADGVGETLLPQVDLAAPHVWVMGNEAWGLEQSVRDLCDEVVRVPIYGKAESLNLAMAATVCLYASAAAQNR
jgi:TrmH family RNA methyltransferase